jgi:tRNA 2-thiouridine synthesizing protein A
MEFDQELDARGFLCPIPILKTKVAMDKLRPGQILKVVSTDPGSVRDMEAFARQTGNPLLHSRVDGEDHTYYLCKGGAQESQAKETAR